MDDRASLTALSSEPDDAMTEQPATTRNPVKAVRQALGLTQLEMAFEFGFVQNAVWHWEKKGSLPLKPAALTRLLFLAKKAGLEIEI